MIFDKPFLVLVQRSDAISSRSIATSGLEDATPLGLEISTCITQGSSFLATLICCFDVIFLTPFMINPSSSNPRPAPCPWGAPWPAVLRRRAQRAVVERQAKELRLK